VYLTCFAEAHWLVAVHFWKAATDTPKVLRKEEVHTTTTQRVVYWTGITLCAIIPIAVGYFSSICDWMVIHGQLTSTTKILASATFVVAMLMLIVISVVETTSLILIHRFMKTVHQNQRISMKAFLIHAAAFAAFLVSALIFILARTL